MLTAASGSPSPTYAPAMNGLSSGMFEKTTSLAQPKPLSRRRGLRRCRRIVRPISATASMLMPARRDATLTDAHTRSVSDRTCGQAADDDGVGRRNALLDEGREAAHEVHAAGGGGLVQRPRDRQGRRLAVTRHQVRRRRNRQPLVRDGDAVLAADAVADLDEARRAAGDLLAQFAADLVHARGRRSRRRSGPASRSARRGARRGASGWSRGFRRSAA